MEILISAKAVREYRMLYLLQAEEIEAATTGMPEAWRAQAHEEHAHKFARHLQALVETMAASAYLFEENPE